MVTSPQLSTPWRPWAFHPSTQPCSRTKVNSRTVVSWIVIVWVVEALFPASSVAVSANNRVVARGISAVVSSTLRRPHRSCPTPQHRPLASRRALYGVVGRDEGELRRGGVLDGDGLGRRAAVSSVVGGRERANDHVVARNQQSFRWTLRWSPHRSCQTLQHVHWRLVRALNGVVGRDEGELEQWCPDRDRLQAEELFPASSVAVKVRTIV